MGFLEDILTMGVNQGASDIHIVSDMPPMFRIHTVLAPAEGQPVITSERLEDLVKEMLNADRLKNLRDHRDSDFSVAVKGLGRFGVNAHYQRDKLAVAFRAISEDVPPLSALNLPSIVETLIGKPRGLVLVTGPTGSGKSTTLASMIEAMNQQFQHHIITLEDPVEYEFTSKMCVIEQRELGSDVPTFASGLRHALRQDPDIILVGEMRDLETTSSAITAAETGHLVLSTLHTQNAAQTIERIIDIYPPGQQNQIRAMLSNTLQAVISMTLFKRLDVPGMVPACEVMVCTPAVRNCIRENRIHEIPNIIETGRSLGMIPLDESIRTLYSKGMISHDQAIARADRPQELNRLLSA